MVRAQHLFFYETCLRQHGRGMQGHKICPNWQTTQYKPKSSVDPFEDDRRCIFRGNPAPETNIAAQPTGKMQGYLVQTADDAVRWKKRSWMIMLSLGRETRLRTTAFEMKIEVYPANCNRNSPHLVLASFVWGRCARRGRLGTKDSQDHELECNQNMGPVISRRSCRRTWLCGTQRNDDRAIQRE